MRTIVMFGGVVSCLVVACATGIPSTTESSTKDGGIVFKGDSGAPHPGHDSGTQKQGNDSGTRTCDGTLCSDQCVDTTSDPNHCGTCGKTCAATETCTAGACVSTTTSNEPPVGSCGHSLCTAGGPLAEGCDTEGCNVVICDPSYLGDSFCCDTSWDAQCVQEVTDYCAPYACN